jgi:ABC-type multidrug transport system fused ATPase/permease subunit
MERARASRIDPNACRTVADFRDPARRKAAARLDVYLAVTNLKPPSPPSPPFRRTFIRLLGFLRPYRWSLAASIVLAVGSQAAGLAIPWLTGRVIDGALPDRDEGFLKLLVLLVALAGLAKALQLVARRFIAGAQALGVEFDLRNALYNRLLRLSWRFYDKHQTGQLMSRATVDLQGVRFFLGYGLIFFTQHILMIVTVGVLVFVIDWKLALASLAVTPALVAVAYLYSRASHPILKDVQQRLADMTTIAEENIVGVNVVKAFAQEQREERKFSQRNEAVFDQSVRAARQRAYYTPFLSFLPLLAQAIALLVGGRRVLNGDLALGAFVAFNVYLLMIVQPLRMLGYWISEFQRAISSGERIFEVIDEPEDVVERTDARPLPPGEGELVFEDVTFGYDPERPVLEDIDLEIEAGRTIALIGHTGSGKSTLAALVPRFYDVTSGRILVDGADVRDVKLTDLRRAIGIVSQDPFLFSATVRENIAFGAPEATDEDVERAARMAQAHEFIAELPDGYDTVIGERGITLSGGQRQRIAIARAIAVDPRILILDDATASVDATTEAKIRLGLREAMRGRTTLIIAHRLSTISLADEVVVLDHGRLVVRGTAEELYETSPVYREIADHGLVSARVLTETEGATA